MIRRIGSVLVPALLLIASPAWAQDGGSDGGAMDGSVMMDATVTIDDLTVTVTGDGGPEDLLVVCDLSSDGPIDGFINCGPGYQPPHSTGSCSVAVAPPTRPPLLLGALAGAIGLWLLRRRLRM